MIYCITLRAKWQREGEDSGKDLWTLVVKTASHTWPDKAACPLGARTAVSECLRSDWSWFVQAGRVRTGWWTSQENRFLGLFHKGGFQGHNLYNKRRLPPKTQIFIPKTKLSSKWSVLCMRILLSPCRCQKFMTLKLFLPMYQQTPGAPLALETICDSCTGRMAEAVWKE